ncbi:MAG: DUF3710 domain-containing protein [Sciscionella sp.]
MGIFRRRNASADRVDEVDPATGDPADAVGGTAGAEPSTDAGGHAEGLTEDAAEATQPVDGSSGPYDSDNAPDDELPRVDLGSVRVPVPDGAQLQVEMEDSGGLRAVHLVTAIGQFTISAYAAPRSGGLWSEVSRELTEQLRKDGAVVHRRTGEWGHELSGAGNDMALSFVGVDGPRWMLRGVVAGPAEHAEPAAELLRELTRFTVVVRGEEPMPVRTPLPVALPEEIAEQVLAAQQEQEQAQAQA